MLFVDALVAFLAVLAVGLPFLWAYTEPPLPSFWPWMASAACALVLCALALGRVLYHGTAAGERRRWAGYLAAGLVLAAVLASGIGLLQYFVGDPDLLPWIFPTEVGQSPGNLRQRNQQATLLSLGVWSLWWWMLQRWPVGARRGDAAPVTGAPGAAPAGAGGVLVCTVLGTLALALASAATASRTGALQWAIVVLLVAWWWGRTARWAVAGVVVSALFYTLAAWWLPQLLMAVSGVQAEGLFERAIEEPQVCTGRIALWSNMLELIAQKPWTGWGWGQLAYAHYITPFEGVRFCLLLDNAHNLPLHLAVELGWPMALLVCAALGLAVVAARPWRECDPVRQLAWGVLALVAVHSLLEFPLWYGPFQIVTVMAVLLLWRRSFVPAGRLAWASLGLLACCAATWVGAAWDFHRVSQLYRPPEARDPDYQIDTHAKVSDTWLFGNAVDFALLTTLPITQETAPALQVLANDLLHYSPEPRVVQRLIETARMAGDHETVALHEDRYRRAYPADFARWQELQRQQRAASSPASTP